MRTLSSTIGACVFVIFGTAAVAVPVSFDFERPVLETEAIELTLNNGEVGSSTPSKPKGHNGNRVLRLAEQARPTMGGASTKFFVPLIQPIENVSVTALVNPAGRTDDQAGVVARGSIETISGYTAAIDFAVNRIVLLKTVGGNISVLDEASNVVPDLRSAYTVNLVTNGSLVTARFLDEAGQDLLGVLRYDDRIDPLPAGLAGLEAEISHPAFYGKYDVVNTSFDDLSIAPVPVPSAFWLLFTVISGLVTFRSVNNWWLAPKDGSTFGVSGQLPRRPSCA